jgi:four helix bundle protein
MAGIERFEDIDAWKEARKLTQEVYRATGQPGFQKDSGLREQLQRASVSIMANIAEGFDTATDREFLQFLSYALRSATEVQSHLYVALDQRYVDSMTFEALYVGSVTAKNLIGGFLRYLKAGHSQ